MGLKKLSVIPILVGLVLLPVTPALADEATASDIAGELICQCGCGRILDSHVCATQEAMVTLIEQQLAQGESREEILDYFVAQYGEPVLASPPKRGFNLTVWIAPIAALLLGGGAVYFALKRWVRRGELQPTTAVTENGEDDKYLRQLEEELEEFVARDSE